MLHQVSCGARIISTRGYRLHKATQYRLGDIVFVESFVSRCGCDMWPDSGTSQRMSRVRVG
jgi:hypothetical protein